VPQEEENAVLTGGLAGQLITLLLGSRFTAKREVTGWLRQEKREFASWLRQERFKAFSELLANTAATFVRQDYEKWPDEIRVLSLRVYLLYEGGRPPKTVLDPIEKLFRLALDRKQGKVEKDNVQVWRDRMRDETRRLREAFAETLHLKE